MSCDVEYLLEAAKCYLDPCTNQAERQAIQIYFSVELLAVLGGPTYTPASLQSAAFQWQNFLPDQLSAISTYINSQNAFQYETSINDIKAAAACYMCLGEATRHQLLTFLQCELAEFGVVFALSGYDGFDPILGAPYPPVNYKAYIFEQLSPPRIRWTVPGLLVGVEVHNSELAEVIIVNNYDSGDTEASQSGTTVTLAGGALRFVDTASDAGRVIRWSPVFPNTSETATIVTVLSATEATVAENQTVVSGKFVYTPPNTIFKLWVFNSVTGLFDLTADSEDPSEPGYIFDYFDLLHQPFPEIGYGPNWRHIADVNTYIPTPAYVTAEAGVTVVSSQTFSVLIPP